MSITDVKFNLKIFSIDKDHYEIIGKSNKEIIEVIRENHKRKMHANDEDIDLVRPNLNLHSEEEFTYFTYCYNEQKDQNYWKIFLPDELTVNQNFELVEFSFVLFIAYKSNIFCVVGGSGFSVIKKYQQSNFGIDLYQHFAKPHEDILLGVNLRGVAGNISQKEHIYSYNQNIG
jgi:hypothetical protein